MTPSNFDKTLLEGNLDILPLINQVEHGQAGSEDGENSLSQGNTNEPEPDTQLGEDGESETFIKPDSQDGDALVKVDQIIDRFRLDAKELRGRTPASYEKSFENFAETMNLEQYSKQQLSGKKGKEILKTYLLDHVKQKSRRTIRASLKTVWTRGLEIPFPVELRDLGQLPDVGRRVTPRDKEIELHIKAVKQEEDPFLRTLVLIIINFGLRPNNVRLLRWKDVRWQEEKPYAIVTDGTEGKKLVPIIAYIPPILSEALIQMKQEIPDSKYDDPILPYRKSDGTYRCNEAMSGTNLRSQWLRFEKKHRLKHWSPAYWRHWVVSTSRNTSCPKSARYAMRGHKFNRNDIEDVYDNKDWTTIVEEQSIALPNGLIGFAFPDVAQITPAIPNEFLDALSKTLSGHMTPTQFQEMITAHLIRRLEKAGDKTTMVL